MCMQPNSLSVCQFHVFKANFHPSPTVLLTMGYCNNLMLSRTEFSAELQLLKLNDQFESYITGLHSCVMAFVPFLLPVFPRERHVFSFKAVQPTLCHLDALFIFLELLSCLLTEQADFEMYLFIYFCSLLFVFFLITV